MKQHGKKAMILAAVFAALSAFPLTAGSAAQAANDDGYGETSCYEERWADTGTNHCEEWWDDEAGIWRPWYESTEEDEPAAGVKGDMDCSGRLTIGDAVLFCRYLAEDESIAADITEQGLANADMDGDGCHTTLDLTAMLKELALLSPDNPDEPGDETGTDGSEMGTHDEDYAKTIRYNLVPENHAAYYSPGADSYLRVYPGEVIKVNLVVSNDQGTAGGRLFFGFDERLKLGRTVKGTAYEGSFQWGSEDRALVWTCKDGHDQFAEDGSVIYSFTVTVPENAESGEYWLGLNYERLSDCSIRPQESITEAPDHRYELGGLVLNVAGYCTSLSVTTDTETTCFDTGYPDESGSGESGTDGTEMGTCDENWARTIRYSLVPEGIEPNCGLPCFILARPGDMFKVNLVVENDQGTAGGRLFFDFDERLKLGRTAKGTAYEGSFQWGAAEHALVWTCKDGHDQFAEDGAVIYSFTVTVPEDAECGEYRIGLNLDRIGDISIRSQAGVTEAPDHLYEFGSLILDVDDWDTADKTTIAEQPYGAVEICNIDMSEEENMRRWGIHAPKTVYQTGEELDLSNMILKLSYGYGGLGTNMVFDPDDEPEFLTDHADRIEVDASEFDSTKPGIYKISLQDKELDFVSGYFYVKVVGGDETGCPDMTTIPYWYESGEIWLSDDGSWKKTYRIGEELDIMDARLYGCGSYYEPDGEGGYSEVYWDAFGDDSIGWLLREGLLVVNITEFDNTKPGTYTIYMRYTDGMASGSFEVTVVDGDVSGTATEAYTDRCETNVTEAYTDWCETDDYTDYYEPGSFVCTDEYLNTDESGSPMTTSETTRDETYEKTIRYGFSAEGWEDYYPRFNRIEVEPGETVKVNLVVANDQGTAGGRLYFDFDERLKFGRTAKGTAYEGSFQWGKEDRALVWTCKDGRNQTAEDGAVIYSFTFTVPEDAQWGDSFIIGLNEDRTGDISIRPEGSVTEAPDHLYSFQNLRIVCNNNVIALDESNSENPWKKEYRIGEELDIMKATIRGVGTDAEDHVWEMFDQEHTVEEGISEGWLTVDASEFDSTKPGTYTIYLKMDTSNMIPGVYNPTHNHGICVAKGSVKVTVVED